MKLQGFWGFCAGMSVLAAAIPASAADPVQPGSAFYVGGNVGYGFGTASATLSDPGAATAGGTNQTGGMFGGVQGGYEHYLPSRLMLGVELDASFTGYMDLSQVMSYRATGAGGANEQLEYLATARGRVGYGLGNWGIGSWTPFLTGGVAWASTRYSRTDFTTGFEDATAGRLRAGYVVERRHRPCARQELVGADGISLHQPRRHRLPGSTRASRYELAVRPASLSPRPQLSLRPRTATRATRRSAEPRPTTSGPGSFEIHGQDDLRSSGGYPAFQRALRAARTACRPSGRGPPDLDDIALFLGMRLWQGGEFYFNPRSSCRAPASPARRAPPAIHSGEAQKSNFPLPALQSHLALLPAPGIRPRQARRTKVEGDYLASSPAPRTCRASPSRSANSR